MKEQKKECIDFELPSGQTGRLVDMSRNQWTQIRVYVGDKWAEWGTCLYEHEHYSEFIEGEDDEVFCAIKNLGYILPSRSEVAEMVAEALERREKRNRAHDFRDERECRKLDKSWLHP